MRSSTRKAPGGPSGGTLGGWAVEEGTGGNDRVGGGGGGGGGGDGVSAIIEL